MRSQAQIDASRANGKKSRGPITAEGKSISSQNAVRHGLLANHALLPGEKKAEFDRILTAAIAKYQPGDHCELELVEELAMHKWRQIRIWAMQIAGHSAEILTQGEEPPALAQRNMAYRAYAAFKEMHPDRRCTELMHRYEAYYASQHNRARRELLRLQKERSQ